MKYLTCILIVFFVFLMAEIDLVKAIQQDTVQYLTEEELAINDSVSIDDLDPVFYTPLEEEEMEPEESGDTSWIIYVVIGIVVVGGGIFFYQRSK